MASARLRKTFKYPSDDEGSQTFRDEMDEEEQENLISNLSTKSQSSNANYTLIFTLLPLTPIPLFIYHLLLNSTSSARIRILCLLSLTSLLASSFTMFFMSSIDSTDARARLDRRQRQINRTTLSAPPHAGPLIELFTRVIDKSDDLRMDLDTEGPLLQALPILNGVMCGLLSLAAWMVKGRVAMDVPEFMWLYLLLPGMMLLMTTIARRSIIDEQRELRELRGLKYGYKGA